MSSECSFSLLIVEDDVDARDIIADMMKVRFRGCTVYTADNGKEGVELFKKYNPAVVVTDINLPVMDGIVMAREIRTLNPATAFVVLTAYTDERFKRSFSEVGFSTWLMKPLHFKELFHAVEKCMDVAGNGGLEARAGIEGSPDRGR